MVDIIAGTHNTLFENNFEFPDMNYKQPKNARNKVMPVS